MLEHIAANKSLQDLRALAADLGHKTLVDDGIDKAANGLTTIQEVIRVASS